MSDPTPAAPPGWFTILREDIAGVRSEFNARLDKLVTQDAFTGEQKRVDEKLAAIGSELVAERTARKEGDDEIRATAEAAAKAASSRRTWWFRLIIGGIVTAGIGAFGTVLLLLFQAYTHLNGGQP